MNSIFLCRAYPLTPPTSWPERTERSDNTFRVCHIFFPTEENVTSESFKHSSYIEFLTGTVHSLGLLFHFIHKSPQ